MINLTPEQQAAVELSLDWLNSPGKQTLRIGGYAGTGKTTIIKSIRERAGCAHAITSFTGKAVSVLRKKGLYDAKTLHTFLYTPKEEKDGSITFTKKLPSEIDVEFIANDESSMISTDLNRDLLETGAKILYVGDPGQLEPVGDNPNLMHKPDYTLKQIHRQAADSPILKLATLVREDKEKFHHYEEATETSSVLVTSKEKVLEQSDEVDQIICGYNNTRVSINGIIRKHKKFDGQNLNLQEKLICLRNDKQRGLFNGMTLYVEKIRSEGLDFYLCDLKDELGMTFSRIKVNKVCLLEGSWPATAGRVPFDHNLFTYGYCITCHKSQGSEWDSVMVFDQSQCKAWTASKWRYTAITRAAKRLVYGI